MKPLPSKPAFCIITPTPYLIDYAIQSERHLVLAHIVDTCPEYAEFYGAMSDRGDYVIMDNGAFELGKSYSPEKLIALGLQCGADAIVLPDYPGERSDVTVQAARDWGHKIKDAGFQLMFVPQSRKGDLEDWIDCYVWASTDKDAAHIDIIGMSILGIPNALPYIPAAYARVVMTQILADRGIISKKYHHYLGLNAGPGLEIPPLMNMHSLHNWAGFSCDSSNPVWMGILGHQYAHNTDSLLPVKKVNKAVDFSYQYEKNMDTHRRIQHNVDLTLNLFK